MKRSLRLLVLLAGVAAATGCGAVRVQPAVQLPPPLVDRLPETVAVTYPAEFREFLHQEERYQVKYEVLLGPAHVAKLRQLLAAMFSRVVEVDDPTKALAADPAVRLVLEPRFEDYAFLTPRDMAGEFYTVTIRYRMNLYSPSGERVDGYVFTGYGRQKSSAFSGTEPLVVATQRAMRDAGAKLAIDLTKQDSVRRLLAGEAVTPPRSREEEVEAALGSFGGATAAPPVAPAAGPPAAEAMGPEAAPEAGEPDPAEAVPEDTAPPDAPAAGQEG